MTTGRPRYWAFISYSSHDSAVAAWLQRALENYVVPRRLINRLTPAGPTPRRYRPIFRDRSELAADPDLVAQIANALEHSAFLIVICSPHAAQSRWVNEEILRFRQLHGQSRILTAIVGDAARPDHASCFPPALRYGDSLAGTAPLAEPIAADLRLGRDGRRMARLKLLAGMMNLGLDELVRRDSQRRLRLLIAVTIASLAVGVVTGTFAVTAYLAKNEAQKQRNHAESLIEFMLTDLRKRLEPSGRLDALDGVGLEALRYYSSQDPSKLDAQSLSRRARVLRLMGEINLQRGELATALLDFQQASSTTQELVARLPGDGQIIFNHAQNVFWVGEIARQRGDTVKAESFFRNYRSLAARLVALDPKRDDWQAEASYADSALGALYLQHGRVLDAIAAFEHSLSRAEQRVRLNSDDLKLQLDLAQSHAWLADSLEQRAKFAEARNHLRIQLQIYQAVLTKDPTIQQAKFSTIDALNALGHLAVIDGDNAAALADFSQSANLGEQLLLTDRGNMDLTGVLASTQVDRGESLLATGKLDGAMTALQRASGLLDTALDHDRTVELWLNCRDRAGLLEAAIAAKNGNHLLALQLQRSLLDRLEARVGTDPMTDRFWLLERARLQTGDELAVNGQLEEASASWMQVIKSLPNPKKSYRPELLIVLASGYQRLGRTVESEAIMRHLKQPASNEPLEK